MQHAWSCYFLLYRCLYILFPTLATLLSSVCNRHGERTSVYEQYICYWKSPKIGKFKVLPVNPSIYHSGVLKVRKMLVNSSISGFYQTISVNAGICWHLLVKVRNERWTDEVAYHLLDIFTTFGAPNILHSDNGGEFCNQIVKSLCGMWYKNSPR